MRRSCIHPHRISQIHGGWNQKCQIWNPDQRTNFHQSNVHCSCFLAQASLFFLLVSLVVVFMQQFVHGCLIHTGSSEQLMLRCVCYLNSVKHLFGLQSEVQLTLMNLVWVFLSCGGPHENLKFMKFSVLSDLHVLNEYVF